MPIRSHLKSVKLKLEIPERKISPRDWSLPYSRPCVSKWRFPEQRKLTSTGFRFTERRSSSSSWNADFQSRNDTSSRAFSKHEYSFGQEEEDGPASSVQGLGSPLLSPQVLDRLGLSGGNSSWSAGESGPPNFDDSNNRCGVSGDGGDVESGDVFFFMKSDSRIRETLGSILKSDRDPICRLWHQMLLKNMPETCLNKLHLLSLLDGLRGFIATNDLDSMKAALGKVMDGLRLLGSHTKITQIATALFVFQEAVNSTLRQQSIKPHWIFALDKLLRDSIETSVSIVHSSRIPGASGDESGPFAFAGGRGHSVERNIPIQRVFRHEEPYHQLSELKEENSRLLNQLQSMQQNYQELLKTNLAEKQVQMQVVLAAKSTGGYRQIVSDSSSSLVDQSFEHAEQLSTTQSYESSMLAAASPAPQGQLVTSREKKYVPGDTPSSKDEEMIAWLKNLNLNEGVVQKFLSEDLTHTDVVQLMSRDDLRRLGLKAGPELRVWKAILNEREKEGGAAISPHNK